MRFDRFMEQALYHPRHGYYSSGRARIGRRGDFYTSVSVSALFGELLARQFAEMWEALDCPKPFGLVEAGAHNGRLAADILGWLSKNRPDVFAVSQYIVVEPSALLRRAQRRTLFNAMRSMNSGVRWIRDIQEIPPRSLLGCIFANELLDAFPVRRVTLRRGKWRELCVTWLNKRFQFVLGHPARFSLPNRSYLREGYTTEFCPAAEKWVQTAARRLLRGWIWLLDYGYEQAEYYAPHRSDGTLLCYYQHRLNNESLARVGLQDITAHVNFTAAARAASKAGATVVGLTDQQHFVVAAAKKILDALDPQQIGAFKTLMHPEHLGRAMKLLVLAQGEGLTRLSGLEYARPIEWR